ncbi:MAG: peptidyl-prolyl cis-trans isomerase, partial [Sulfitobacter sp.]
SGTIRTIGTVGSKSLPVDQYARRLQQQIRAVEAESGEPMPFATAQAIGLDRAVLQQMVSQRALDHETSELGLSIGDASLRDRILDIRAFNGIDGEFDREGYRFSLEQAGMSEAQFETQLREETARTLLQGAVSTGVVMPSAYADTLVAFITETRDFTWAKLDETHLAAPIAAPDDATLQAYYDENIADFTLPETKRLTYAALIPDALFDEIEVEEEALQRAYDARAAEFNQPQRRLVERLAFLDQDSADAAATSLQDRDSSFENLVEDRGLTLADVDLGDVGRLELDAAGEAVFAAEVGDVVGPLPSPVGPALFRVNGVLPAQLTTLEQAKPELQQLLVADRAVRLIEAQIDSLDDLLAGGATLEELANETDMTLGTLDWRADSSDDIAAYEGFRNVAAGLTADDFPEIAMLDDGGIFAVRLDELVAPRPAPFADVRAEVMTAWQASETEAQLRLQAEALLPQLQNGDTFADAGLDAIREEGLLRNGFVAGTPAGFLADVFDMETGDAKILDAGGAVVIVRLDAVKTSDDFEAAQTLRDQLQAQTNQALAQDLLDIFSTDVTMRAGPEVDQRAINAVHVNFP